MYNVENFIVSWLNFRGKKTRKINSNFKERVRRKKRGKLNGISVSGSFS